LFLSRLEKKYPNEYGLLMSLGNLYGYNQDVANSLRYFRKAYDVFPNETLARHIQTIENQVLKNQTNTGNEP
jgi:hypothetical protein